MDVVIYICLTALACIGTYYFGVNDGIKLGAHSTFIAYVQELIEVKQRMSPEAWTEFANALSVINDRKIKLNSQNNTKKH